jgi:hypothetical protein
MKNNKNNSYSNYSYNSILLLIVVLFLFSIIVIGNTALIIIVSNKQSQNELNEKKLQEDLLLLLNSSTPTSPPPPQQPSQNMLYASYGLWYIPITNDSITLDPGDRVPFLLEIASKGITKNNNYGFILENDGDYSCTTSVVSGYDSFFFDLVSNPGTINEQIIKGSEFNSDAQQNSHGINPIIVTFTASTGDEIVLFYNNSAYGYGDSMLIGSGAIKGPNPTSQPIAFINFLQIS